MEKNFLLEKGKKIFPKFFLLKRELSLPKMEINISYNDNRILTNKIGFNKKRKIRNPGIDFVRILSMYVIIIHHILLFGKVIKKYRNYKELIFLNISCFWHVNSYALISGYIGHKSNKYSNLIYLWICVLFYSVGITYFFEKYISQKSTVKINFVYYFPVNFNIYWYFTKYFGMYQFLPVINKGIEYLTKKELRIVFISLILVYVILKDIINPGGKDIYTMHSGYSVVWLLILYLTGVYFGKFNKEYKGIKKIVLIIIYIFVFYFSTYLCFYFSNYPLSNSMESFKMKIIIILKYLLSRRINSLPMILQSISITLLLTQIKYNKYIAKIITFFGPLNFGIYIIHMHSFFLIHIISKLFEKDSYNLNLYTVVKLVLFRGLKIIGICLIIDYLRNLLFIFLRIRKICIFFEKIIYKLF